MNTGCLIEASLDPIVTVNIDGKITEINQALAKYYWISQEKNGRH